MIHDPRSEVKERYEAQRIRDDIRHELIKVDQLDKLVKKNPPPQPPEDEEGFVRLGHLLPVASQATHWRVPRNDEWRDGEPWSWLHGRAS